jgi:hypothetical protein
MELYLRRLTRAFIWISFLVSVILSVEIVLGKCSMADGLWYGNVPKIIFYIRGKGVDDVIRKIDHVAHTYPYRDTYTVWPGPNSNTFTAFVA